jgi:hypothetical protein
VVSRPPSSEAALVERARRGDSAAYEALVRAHQDIAFRTACLMAGSSADAEEAAQEAFVKAWRALPRFRAGAPFRPWLLVRGAMGRMGEGNTAVLMQLLVGMLDAALARQQDEVPPDRRVAVALKIDEAPLVINRGFAQTMALKRSAGLETVACW